MIHNTAAQLFIQEYSAFSALARLLVLWST